MLSAAWATCYSKGDGVAHDAAQAVSRYRRAAEAGHVLATFNLGVATLRVTAVANDAVQASLWYRRAAEAGHAPAQHELSRLGF